MKADKFLLRSGSWRAMLAAVVSEMDEFSSDNSTLESGLDVEAAAGAVDAARRILGLVEERCQGKEFIP